MVSRIHFVPHTILGVAMKTRFFFLLLICPSILSAQDWQSVENILGRKGTVQGEVFKAAFPRTDLDVRIGSVKVSAGLALTSWIAFKNTSSGVVMMGDLVMLESEVRDVEEELVRHGIDITALHNHIIGETPGIMYLHFMGYGQADSLAGGMKAVLSHTATPTALPAAEQEKEGYDWSAVEKVLGKVGKKKGMLIQFGIPRAESISDMGVEIPPFMGAGTAINMQMTNGVCATTGDFVLVPSEVQSVVKALTHNHITVTAIHNHMLFESPRLIFLHFWGTGAPSVLATGLHAALQKTNSN